MEIILASTFIVVAATATVYVLNGMHRDDQRGMLKMQEAVAQSTARKEQAFTFAREQLKVGRLISVGDNAEWLSRRRRQA